MIRGVGHGLAVDWWALGVMVHELVGEEPPYFCVESLNYLYEVISIDVLQPSLLYFCRISYIRILI